ncbi:X-linked retinitis pigmentosa GTPase regulator-interacting protein 1 [Rhizophlyctis rosea]|nr:X-linked retinitis pigmentosa GTPase regulator-interacting protein 1 [Rhizophlyctis rosea]
MQTMVGMGTSQMSLVSAPSEGMVEPEDEDDAGSEWTESGSGSKNGSGVGDSIAVGAAPGRGRIERAGDSQGAAGLARGGARPSGGGPPQGQRYPEPSQQQKIMVPEFGVSGGTADAVDHHGRRGEGTSKTAGSLDHRSGSGQDLVAPERGVLPSERRDLSDIQNLDLASVQHFEGSRPSRSVSKASIKSAAESPQQHAGATKLSSKTPSDRSFVSAREEVRPAGVSEPAFSRGQLIESLPGTVDEALRASREGGMSRVGSKESVRLRKSAPGEVRPQSSVPSRKESQQIPEMPRRTFEEESGPTPSPTAGEGLSINITSIHLNLTNSAVLHRLKHIRQLFVSFRFMEYPPEDLETRFVTLEPERKIDTYKFDYSCFFSFDPNTHSRDRFALQRLITSPNPIDTIISFAIVSEPPEDSAGEECEDVGVAELDLGDLIRSDPGGDVRKVELTVWALEEEEEGKNGTELGLLSVTIGGIDLLRRIHDDA